MLPFQPDEVTRLEDHVIAWHGQFRLAVVGKVVIPGKKKDAADRASRRLFDLIEYRAAGNEVRLPVQDFSANAKQIALDGRGSSPLTRWSSQKTRPCRGLSSLNP